MNTFCKGYFIIFLISLLLTACGSVAKSAPTPDADAAVTQAPTIQIFTPTFVNTPTAVVASPTALPVVSNENTEQVLAQFIQENGGCVLPCLLGLSPVYSDRISVEMFAQYFQRHSRKSNNQINDFDLYGHFNNDYGGGARVIFWKDRVRVDVNIGASFVGNDIKYIAFSTGVYEHVGEFTNEAAAILSDHPDYDELLGHFSLPRILRDYGSPAEIWIMPFPEDELHRSTYATGGYPFDFVLIYPDKGFAVEYMARVKDEGDGYLTACPNTAYMNISSWNPKGNPQFSEIATYFSRTDSLSASNFAGFKQIQEVTSLGVKDFHELYSDPNYHVCVKTPRNLWP
jgi:hypothetical protein